MGNHIARFEQKLRTALSSMDVVTAKYFFQILLKELDEQANLQKNIGASR